MYIVKATQSSSSQDSCICFRLSSALLALAWYNTATVYKITWGSLVGRSMPFVAMRRT